MEFVTTLAGGRTIWAMGGECWIYNKYAKTSTILYSFTHHVMKNTTKIDTVTRHSQGKEWSIQQMNKKREEGRGKAKQSALKRISSFKMLINCCGNELGVSNHALKEEKNKYKPSTSGIWYFYFPIPSSFEMSLDRLNCIVLCHGNSVRVTGSFLRRSCIKNGTENRMNHKCVQETSKVNVRSWVIW